MNWTWRKASQRTCLARTMMLVQLGISGVHLRRDVLIHGRRTDRIASRVSLCVMLLAILGDAGCNGSNDNGSDNERFVRSLESVGEVADMANLLSALDVPLEDLSENEKFVTAAHQELGMDDPRVQGLRVEGGVVIDGWGHPLIFLADPARETLVIGSAGADGRWEAGKGDDIRFEVKLIRFVHFPGADPTLSH